MMRRIALAVMVTSITTACATATVKTDYDLILHGLLQSDFVSKGPTKVERIIKQDEVQRLCSAEQLNLSDVKKSSIQNEQLKTIKYPSDGKYLGNWEDGEKIAQNGRGLQSSDPVGAANGGNCYACHQITKKELAYGNIGPSLYNYVKLHGKNEKTIKYTWGKIYNSQAFNACSSMPRFGHSGILDEKQIKDVMALLLDPESPVNK
jgi:L-cysteine S-thiosulfotransferase